MKTKKTEWQPINIPKVLFKRLQKLIVGTGHPSVAEFVREAVNKRVEYYVELKERFEL